MYSKTAGESKINGYDTDKDLDIVRRTLGICPQHNMLFPELTVREHFTMFGMVSSYHSKIFPSTLVYIKSKYEPIFLD